MELDPTQKLAVEILKWIGLIKLMPWFLFLIIVGWFGAAFMIESARWIYNHLEFMAILLASGAVMGVITSWVTR